MTDPSGFKAIRAEADILAELTGEELSRLYPEDPECQPMTINELAEHFQVSRRSLHRWMTEEGFPESEPGPRKRWCPYWIWLWHEYYRVPVPDRRWRWRGDRIR